MAQAKAEEVLSSALARIKPAKAEEDSLKSLSEEIKARLAEKIPKEIALEVVGSVAKGTSLRNEGDIDLFMLFPKHKYSHSDLAKTGLEYAKHALRPGVKWEIGYAEHPYLRAKINGKKIDIVPAFKIMRPEELGSAADRSPLHVQYVLKRMTSAQRDDVRLLKKFLKRLAAYGAELKIEGFSGYLCELLILHAGSFIKLAEEACSWHNPVADMERAFASKDEARRKFAYPPLVVVDPVDKGRNVAAAVSETSLSKFIVACRAFLKAPSPEFFFESSPRITPERLKEMKKRLLGRETPHDFVMRFKAPDVVPDVLWPQLRRTARILFDRLEQAGFRVFDYNYWTDEDKACIIIFEFDVHTLPEVEKIAGPEIKYSEGVADFIRKHKGAFAGPWVGGNRLYAAKKRRFTKAGDLIEYIATHPREFAMPENIAEFLPKYKRLRTPTLLKPKYAPFLYDYLYKKHYYIQLY
mgnify:CR=1 FL=1